jgi:NAD(P)-dependent dehydrogenase (short-subunit alcohol dehydrogenase family)
LLSGLNGDILRTGNGIALVTGGASGLGRATAQALVAAGNPVLIADADIMTGKQAAHDLGPSAVFAACDVTEPRTPDMGIGR